MVYKRNYVVPHCAGCRVVPGRAPLNLVFKSHNNLSMKKLLSLKSFSIFMNRKRIRRKIDEELVLQLYENGYNIARLAKHFKVYRSVIERVFEDNGIRYNRPVSKEIRPTPNRNALYEMFVLRYMKRIIELIELDEMTTGPYSFQNSDVCRIAFVGSAQVFSKYFERVCLGYDKTVLSYS